MDTVPSKKALWAGRIISGLFVLFLAFDAIAKILQLAPVMEASAKLGLATHVIPILGVVLLLCTLLYAFRPTAPLGALLLTGYLGGAIATHVLINDVAFTMLFPIIMGVLLWVGLLLRDRRMKVLLPWQ